MKSNRTVLSVESLGERIVPDAAPVALESDPPPTNSTMALSQPLAPNPPEAAPPPRQLTPLEAATHTLEERLREKQDELRFLETDMLQTRMFLEQAVRSGDLEQAGYLLAELLNLSIQREVVRKAYDELYDFYKRSADTINHTVPADISNFDPRNVGAYA